MNLELEEILEKNDTYANTIHIRLVATLLKTTMMVYAKESKVWHTLTPLFGNITTPICKIYLMLEGPVTGGHYKLIKDIRVTKRTRNEVSKLLARVKSIIVLDVWK